jgi:hypothetical protein
MELRDFQIKKYPIALEALEVGEVGEAFGEESDNSNQSITEKSHNQT